MSEVLFKISYDFKFVYDRNVHICEQNQQNRKLSEGSDMDLKADFCFSTFACPN